jgi:hypothetical protein
MKTQPASIKPAPLGSISHGTLRTEDLLNTFASTLEGLIFINGDYYCRPENFSERDKLNNLVEESQDQWTEAGDELQDEDTAQELINDLSYALEQFAPSYCYFGAHEGDGSDFGFWPCMEQIEELPDVQDSDEAKALGEDCKFVNDHGNVTVYSGDGSVILELV